MYGYECRWPRSGRSFIEGEIQPPCRPAVLARQSWRAVLARSKGPARGARGCHLKSATRPSARYSCRWRGDEQGPHRRLRSEEHRRCGTSQLMRCGGVRCLGLTPSSEAEQKRLICGLTPTHSHRRPPQDLGLDQGASLHPIGQAILRKIFIVRHVNARD